MGSRRRTARIAAALCLLLTLGLAPVSATASQADRCDRRLESVDQLLACVDADDVYEHLEALADIADDHDGTRASGTPGYDASADYIADLAEDAGLVVERQEFDFTLFAEISSELVVNGEPAETTAFSYSPSGSVANGAIRAIDLQLGLGNTSTSACEETDFDGVDLTGAADVALIQRGTCPFSVKAVNAQQAGAEAVVIFNQGDTEERTGLVLGTVGEGSVGTLTIPVLAATYATGEELAADGATVSLSAETEIDERTTSNVLAELEGVDADAVVMAGAHLDSVPEGPGINDNGSGSAAILAVALTLADSDAYTPQRTLRFAWWGAEESGLIGSTEYVSSLSESELAQIDAYLNFDMVGSPNYYYGVYDADQSSFPAPAGVPIPDGSTALEDLFEEFFSAEDIPYDDSEFSGRSDYQAFIAADIPSSGLFTGAEVVKTEEQADVWGGTAGDQFDPCYHLACDTIDNVSREAVDVNVDAIASAIFTLASRPEIDGPQGTFVGEDGGLASAPDHGGS